MTTNLMAPAVRPIVDYEPPTCAVGPGRLLTLLRPARRHPPTVSPDRRLRTGRTGRAALPPATRDAAAFAETALRRVLEVVDQRRPAAHLYPLLTVGLVQSVLSAPPAARCAGAATLHRVRLQMAVSADPAAAAAAEVFGTYRRGRRIHALACRLERPPTGSGPGWQVVALHIG